MWNLFCCCRRVSHLPPQESFSAVYNRDLNCSSCQSLLAEQVCRTACNHIFHAQCLVTWNFQPEDGQLAANHLQCPLCKKEITLQSLPQLVNEQLPEDHSCRICLKSVNATIQKIRETVFLQSLDGKQKFHPECVGNFSSQYETFNACYLPGPAMLFPAKSRCWLRLFCCPKDLIRL